MGLIRLEEDGLPGLKVDDVEDKGAEDSHISREVLVEGRHKFTLLLVLISRLLGESSDQLLDLLGDGSIVGRHERGEHLLESRLLLLLADGRSLGKLGLERRGCSAEHRGKLGDGRDEGGDLRRRAEATEAGEGSERNSHLGLLVRGKL